MKEIYVSPEMEEVLFESEDIVTVSFTWEDDGDQLPPTVWG